MDSISGLRTSQTLAPSDNHMRPTTYITGQSCRLPGAQTVEDFRRLLNEGRCAVSSIPQDRWQHDLFYHPSPGTKGKSYSFAAGVLDDIWGFDLAVFNISPREAHQMDPQQRLLLQVVWEALEDAHLDPQKLAGQDVGVFVGASSMDHATILGGDASLADSYLMTGNTLSLVSNRISHAFDLRGPSFTVDTACSSAMVALDQARQALESGRIDTAIVAGVNVLLNPSSFVGFSAARMLSEKGLCQSFSAKADGYVRGEGCVAIVLQRDTKTPARARAKLIGSDTNSDGFTMNVALPSAQGQSALLEGLYTSLDVSADSLSFIEAHGTGTLVGDPIEAHALGRALARKRTDVLPMGSVKSNVGHLEPASGLVGVLKTLIAFEDCRLPPSLHADELNPHINFEEENLLLARDTIAFDPTKPMIAGVSSFGFGGVNGHCVLQKVTPRANKPPDAPSGRERIFVTSAFCDASLAAQADSFATHLSVTDLEPGGMPDRLWHGRGLYPKRLGVLAGSAELTSDALAAFARGEKHPHVVTAEAKSRSEPTVFAYSGNGAQHNGMSLQAFEQDADFREMYHRIDREFQAHTGWSLIQKLQDGLTDADFEDCLVAQSLLFADQAAQTHALAQRGIKPAAVVGHSAGEVAAAWAAGILDLPQAVSLVVSRSKPQSKLINKGTMAAFQTDADHAQTLIDGFSQENPPTEYPIEIAAVNSPTSVTLVGPVDLLQAFSKWVKRQHRLACILLPINYPYHSAQLEPYEQELHDALAGLALTSSDVPFFSSTEGAKLNWADLTIDYWWRNIRNPVQFGAAVGAALEAGFKSVLEVGAQPVLTSYIAATVQKQGGGDVSVGHTLAKSDPKDVNPMARAALFAILKGVAHDEGLYFARPTQTGARLPHYPWQNTEIRSVDSKAITQSLGTNPAYHSLLGRPTSTDNSQWRRDLDDQILPALQDHKVADASILPGMALAEMAYAAACHAAKGKPVELHNIDLIAPMVLSGGMGVEVQSNAMIETGTISVQSRARLSDDVFRDHLRASFSVLSSQPKASSIFPPDPILESDNIALGTYRNSRRVGLNYGPSFQGLSKAKHVGDEVYADLKDGIGLTDDVQIQGFDPVQLDCILHCLINAFTNSHFDLDGLALLPVRMARLQVYLPGARLSKGHLTIRRRGTQSVLVDVTAFDAKGRVALGIEGLRLQAVSVTPKISFAEHAYHFGVEPAQPLPALPAVDLARLQSAFESAVDAGHDESDAFLLMNAATHQSIWTAFSECAGKGGVFSLRDGFDHAERRWLDMLQSMDLAEPATETGHWIIAETCDLPDAATIAFALLEERSDLISELSVLMRLPSAITEFLTQDIESDDHITRLFGHHVANELATFEPTATGLLTAVSDVLAKQFPSTARGRLATIGNAIVCHNAASHSGATVKRHHLCAAGDAVDAPHDVIKSTPEDALVFDVMLTTEPEKFATAEFDTLVSEGLKSGGHLAILRAAPPALRMALVALDSATDLTTATAEQTKQAVARLGLNICHTLQIPDSSGGGEIYFCQKPSDAVQDPIMDETSETPSCWEDIWSDRFGQVTRTSGPLVHIEPADQDAPVLVLGPKAPDTHSLANEILCLRDIAATCAAAKRGLIAILPKGAQYSDGATPDPNQHALWAMLRTIANEHPDLPIQALDTAALTDCDWTEKRANLEAALDTLAQEPEVILYPSGPKALRVRQGLPPLTDSNEISTVPLETYLERAVSGGLAKLSWTARPRRELAPQEVEVEVAATGLNYRDVMWAMGLLPEEALENGFAGPTLGLECAGHVSRIGRDVSDLKVGQSVLAFGPSCFASHLISDQAWVAALPEGIPAQDAAALPVAYFTAHYALMTLARLDADDTVLIHGGAGGVGLAAIAVAQKAGARIIATAGSPVKQQLLKELDVDHVLSSRDASFVQVVRRITDGKGVDVVLNSLAGQAMSDSLGLLRPYGRFLELGKQDYYANTHVGLRALKDNVSYFGVDIDSFLADRPKAARRVFAEVVEGLTSGDYPTLPYTKFEADQTVDAFRLMQRSGPIGKIVIAPKRQVSQSNPLSANDTFMADPSGWHVIAGGLGGLGLEVADWLSARGATRIALLGRSGTAGAEAEPVLSLLHAKGVDIRTIACDIAQAEALEETLGDLREAAPIASIFHSAMVLEDQPLHDLSHASLARTLPVKTTGLANLDQLTRKDNLQAFVAFTSLATLIGNHGQAAYVAANAYQDALIKNRHALGLPALAIGWGAVTDAGYVTRDEKLARMLAQVSGNVPFQSTSLLHALGRLLSAPIPGACVSVTPMKWGPSAAALKVLARPTHEALKQLADRSSKGRDMGDLRAELQALPYAKAVKRAVAFLKAEVATILRVQEANLSPARPLSEYGMDSLMGVEMGLAAQAALGDDLPVPTLADEVSIEKIAEMFVSHIHSASDQGEDNPAGGSTSKLKQKLQQQHMNPSSSEASS
ncbi:SDR family NAD(P)-dependent oxidoreductase [Cognatishimia sp.]|uniref:SDR family NAD(P)-dependent oxidoreductase n=1 Tax=Cognatishimia sp. TaxID=2211648 RepID=UPI003519053B